VEELGIIKFCYIKGSSKCNIPKIQGSGYKCCQILGIAPQEKENDGCFRKAWAEKIIHYLNNDVKWKYENLFKFKVDVMRTLESKVCSSLDECLLDEDIGGFVGIGRSADRSASRLIGRNFCVTIWLRSNE